MFVNLTNRPRSIFGRAPPLAGRMQQDAVEGVRVVGQTLGGGGHGISNLRSC
jgi:hypothetical protein